MIDANVDVRHERGGLMLGGYEADPLQPDVLPDDVAALPLDIEGRWDDRRRRASRRAAGAHDRRPLPRGDAARRRQRPVVGAGGGQAPCTRRSRRESSTGAPALDLSEISPTRLAGRDLDETDLRERCRHAYATHYCAGDETPAAS